MGLGLDMLDVVIGVVFVYLLLSLIATAAAEVWAGFTKKRAKELEKGIIELIRDPDVVQKIYNHPLVNGLYEGVYGKDLPKKQLPSYIPARSFALAMMDLFLPGGAARATNPTSDTEKQQASVQAAAATMVTTANRALAAAPQPTPADPTVSQALRAVVTLVNAAAGDAEKARTNIEDWYNTAMDRVSGWYKKKTQTFLFIIGLVLAVGLNVDSIQIVRVLSLNKPKRDAVVGIAINYAKTSTAPPTKPAQTESTQTQPQTPANTAGSAAPSGSATTTGPAPSKPAGSDGLKQDRTSQATPPGSDPLKDAQAALAKLDDLGLPIGWKQYGCPCDCDRNPTLCDKLGDGTWIRCWLLVLAGWLMTAFAVSLGAPFWFDTLNKIIVVRSTVKPQEKSGTEGGKEPQQPAK